MFKRVRAYIAVGVCLLVLVVASQQKSAIAASDTGGINFTTSPVTLNLAVKPGTSTTQVLQIMNNTSAPAPITMLVKTFGAYGSSGQAAISDFLPGNPAPSWIKLSPSTFVAQPDV